MKSNKIAFDELDLKVIESLPKLSELISATYNKIAELFKSHHADFEKSIMGYLKSSLRIKKWEVWGKNDFNTFEPFTDVYYTNSTKINNLKPEFSIDNCVTLKHKKEKEWVYIDYGYWMKINEEDFSTECNHIYFAVYRADYAYRDYHRLYAPSFYKRLKDKLNANTFYGTIEIEHREGKATDKRDEECMWLWQSEIDSDKFEHNYKLFMDIVVKDYISNLPEVIK